MNLHQIILLNIFKQTCNKIIEGQTIDSKALRLLDADLIQFLTLRIVTNSLGFYRCKALESVGFGKESKSYISGYRSMTITCNHFQLRHNTIIFLRCGRKFNNETIYVCNHLDQQCTNTNAPTHAVQLHMLNQLHM